MRNKKKTPVYVPILWALVTGIWSVNVILKISSGDTQGFQFVLLCATTLLSGVVAVVSCIRYKRNKSSEDEKGE